MFLYLSIVHKLGSMIFMCVVFVSVSLIELNLGSMVPEKLVLFLKCNKYLTICLNLYFFAILIAIYNLLWKEETIDQFYTEKKKNTKFSGPELID